MIHNTFLFSIILFVVILDTKKEKFQYSDIMKNIVKINMHKVR